MQQEPPMRRRDKIGLVLILILVAALAFGVLVWPGLHY